MMLQDSWNMFNRDYGTVTDMWKVVFSKRLYERLEEFLFSSAPRENGCFLLVNSYKTKSESVLLVTDIIRPTTDSWNYTAIDALEPSSSYINRCVVAADFAGSGLVFVHTHPSTLHISTFSRIDIETNRLLFANISQILPRKPIGSLVFSRKGICGVIYDGNAIRGVSRIKVIGNTLVEFPGIGYENGNACKIRAEFDRQVRMLGERGQKRLQDIRVTIVGVGGTGSPTAVQLAKMGVMNLQLIDMDVIDKTNIPRVYGAGDGDIGMPKVEVVKKHIGSFSKANIHAICADATSEDMLAQLIDSDVIFACSDNLTSRSVLNEISNRYCIPLIDVGCRVRLDDNDAILQAVAKVQIVTPGSACLWCTGTLDGKTILQESLPEEEKRRLSKEGYYDGIEKQPSIISLTTMAASMGVNKLLSLIGAFGAEYNSRTQIELKEEFMIDDMPEIKDNCVCRKNMGNPRDQYAKELQGELT